MSTVKPDFLGYICTMNLPMRINFEEIDYTYTIFTKGISKETAAIDIHLNGTDYQLVCDANGEWNAVDATLSDYPGLLKAIGRNIKLRYRL